MDYAKSSILGSERVIMDPSDAEPTRCPKAHRRTRRATHPIPAISAKPPNAANKLPWLNKSMIRNDTTAAAIMYLLSIGLNAFSEDSVIL
ncbi:MAG: hypothetical protein ABSC06_01400 [Rhodopila sp.]